MVSPSHPALFLLLSSVSLPGSLHPAKGDCGVLGVSSAGASWWYRDPLSPLLPLLICAVLMPVRECFPAQAKKLKELLFPRISIPHPRGTAIPCTGTAAFPWGSAVWGSLGCSLYPGAGAESLHSPFSLQPGHPGAMQWGWNTGLCGVEGGRPITPVF